MDRLKTTANPAIGVALGGGGAAAMAHIGILEELERGGIRIDCAAGTSAGSLVAGAYASGCLDTLADTVVNISWTDLLSLFNPRWPRLGLFEGQGGLDLVKPCLAESIEDLKRPFAAVATDVRSGEEVLLDSGPLLDAIRASSAIPGIFTPRTIEGRILIDGGLVNPVPVSAVRRLGADIVIASSLFPLPEGVVEGTATIATGGPQQPDEMGILDILAQSSSIVQAQLAASRLRNESPEVLVIAPTANVGLFELHRSAEVVEAGRRVGRLAVPAVRAAIERWHDRAEGDASPPFASSTPEHLAPTIH